MTTNDIVTVAISATSAAISVASVLIALRSMKRQREAQTWTANQSMIIDVNRMLKDDPNLFRILGIEPDDVLKDGITMSELTFIFLQLNISSGIHFVRGNQETELTFRNKQFLQNAKVRLVWKKYLRKNVFTASRWSNAVDAYIAELEANRPKAGG
jgi:hypothetical protein